MSKISYATYIARRLSGFDGDTPREPGQDLVEFPDSCASSQSVGQQRNTGGRAASAP